MSMTMKEDTRKQGGQAGVSQDEAELRGLIGAWARALEAKDVEGLVANYVPEAVLFDVKPPYKTVGVGEIRKVWEQCLPHFPKSFKSEHRELKLVVGEDVAFCYGVHGIRPEETGHPAGQSWIRVTACYRKIQGKWRVVHEHVSMPFDCTNGQVVAIKDEDLGK